MSRIGRWFAAAIGLAVTTASWSWGAEGHRMVGYVADAELSAKARISVRRIMNADSLASVSTWMDEVRGSPEGHTMQRWHFVSINACGAPAQKCKSGNCATARIEWARETLKTSSPEDALKALRVLVHLIGDIHQPLHAADNGDYGGNGTTVTNRLCVAFGASQPAACKLHMYWDSSMVKVALRGQSEAAAAKAWADEFPKATPSDAEMAVEWAAESNQLARRIAYRFDGFTCKAKRQSFAADDAYDALGVATVKEQIVKAGRRLAMTLNSTFD
jgi:S1/P1 Nuclease